jgi:C-terminal of Roc, COR, domain
MSDKEAQDFVRISHRLGHLIHYGHDPLLKEMVILKPDWLATAVSFVLDDEETRNKHGLVKFTRLSKLWSDNERAEEFRYSLKVHPIFVALMERFDLSYRVAGSPLGGQAEETSLIAQLVPDIRPEKDIAREWPEQLHDGDEQQIQICRIVDEKGQSASAEGLFYQLIVRLHKFSLGREDFNASVHWQKGLIVDDDYNGCALLEHVGNDVRITVRAAYPGNLLAVLTHEVKWLVENFWEGLKCQVVVPCIEPCGTNSPGTGLFEVEKLLRSKRPTRPEYPCPVCNEWQNIECLLRNAPVARRPSIELLLTEGFGDVRSRLNELRQHNLVMDQNMKRILSQVEDTFRGVMQTITDEGKDGPRLFSLEPIEGSKFNPNGWVKKKFRVTLWCEHTHLPLPLLNKNEDEGVYEFDVTREWFATAAPFLKVLTGTLSLVLPVAISSAKLSLGEAAYKGLERQLDFGKHCAEAMLNATGNTADWLIEKDGTEVGRTGVLRAHGGVLREFQVWLKKEDPGFGDLRKILNKQKEFLWVHRDFEREY